MSIDPNRLSGTKNPSEAKTIPTGVYPPGPFSPAGVFSNDAHDNLLKSKGFKAIHYRHALNPIRRTPDEGVLLDKMDMTGYRFYDPKELYIVPQNLSWEDSFMVHGVHGKHTMTINHTGKYTDEAGERVFLRSGDLIVLEGEDTPLVMMEDLIEYPPSGINRLRFPVYAVDYMADSTRRYEEGTDFNVIDGEIIWSPSPLGTSKPGFGQPIRNQPVLGSGTVLSCVYWTKPFLVVIDTPRVFRMVWSNTIANAGETSQAAYLPGSAVVGLSWLHPHAKLNEDLWPS